MISRIKDMGRTGGKGEEGGRMRRRRKRRRRTRKKEKGRNEDIENKGTSYETGSSV